MGARGGDWNGEAILSTTVLPLSHLVEAISKHDARLLDDLRRLVDEKRQKVLVDR